MTHALKTWIRFYAAINDGSKTFELRKDDRPFKVGDILLLQEFDEKKNEYTDRELSFKITYILRDASFFGLKEGFCILGLTYKP